MQRLIAVGGTGTAEVAHGIALMNSYFFPSEYEGGTHLTGVIKEWLQKNTLDLVFISSPNFLEDKEQTGKYRTGKDNLALSLPPGAAT